MADPKYTHQGADSPGLHQTAPSPHADYPRVLYKQDGDGATRTVGSAAEEADALKEGWSLSKATQAAREAVAGVTATVTALLLAIGLALVAVPARAQTAVTQTTLSAALAAPAQGASAQLVSLASASGISAPTATAPGTELFVDAEAMLVTSLSGTTATVIRGYDGSKAGSHASGATVYAGPVSGTLGSPFVATGPPVGSCVASQQPYSLTINTITGVIWSCTNSAWQAVTGLPFAGTTYPAINTALASATTIAPNLGVTHITGTTAIATITVPTGCSNGCAITLVPNGLWTTTTAGNIAIASTAVVSKALILTYDATAGKWYPSY